MSTTAASNSHRYQRWPGRLNRLSAAGGWLSIVGSGVRLGYRRSRTQLLLLMAPLFVVFTCVVFYLISLVETLVGTGQAEGPLNFVQGLLQVNLSGVTRLAEYREVLWRTVFVFVMQLQLFWVMVVVARVGPGLIANDVKARALPIYFARPITPLTYLLGKWMVAAIFIGLVTLVPNLVALILGVLLTGGLQTWGQTLGLGSDLLVCGTGIMVFGGILILTLSSKTSDSRYVAVGWLAVCLLPVMAQAIVHDSLDPNQTTGFLGSISLRGNVMTLSKWLFDLREAWAGTGLPPDAYARALGSRVQAVYPAIVLGVITLLSAAFCYRRVLRFSRSAANV